MDRDSTVGLVLAPKLEDNGMDPLYRKVFAECIWGLCGKGPEFDTQQAQRAAYESVLTLARNYLKTCL